jgi:hypothetical protein
VILILLGLGLAAVPALALTSNRVHLKLNQAFEATRSAEADGGNISSLVRTLNQAINLTQKADRINATNPAKASQLYSNASSLASLVLQEAPGVAAQGRASVSASTLEFYGESAVLAVLAVLAYILTPQVFWKLWVMAHKGWKVRHV